ncbi:uncharacterized protein DS421_4g123610 [Arachis hypogaea]|nr:uncharacterized protein DS421_4g123610 [Arachis hypogaea]
MGVARQKLGVACQYNFSESNIEGHQRGVARQVERRTPSPLLTIVRATWCRRRGTPTSKVTWACHLRSQAWHDGVFVEKRISNTQIQPASVPGRIK